MALQSIRLLLWLLALWRNAALEQSYTEYATLLRAHLMNGLDAAVPPKSVRTVDYSQAGTEVRMSIRFFKVQGVSASEGQMRLKVWVRMTWSDLRLAWDPAAFGNVTETTFRAVGSSDLEGTEIWVPDIQLYNSNEGNQATLEGANPIAYNDGTVFWSRPGILDTMCRFTGLVAFPFDRLKCAMEWGGWSLSDGLQGINLTDVGYVFLTNEDTAGASYQEYGIRSVDVSLKQTFYDALPNQPWTIVKYTVELERATFYYGTLILFPTILITYLSFGVFFMSHEVGERLSFGITLLLVVEVMRTSVAAFVPICGELLWIDLFMLVNSIFCCLSLLETMLVLFFAFHTDEHLLPDWLAWLAPWLFCGSEAERRALKVVESQAGQVYRRISKGILQPGKSSFRSLEQLQEQEHLSESDTAKLIFFENLFYMLDSDSNGLIAMEDASVMLSFVNLSRSRDDLEKILTAHFSEHHRLNCADFVEICVEIMWNLPFEEIRMGAENYNSSYMRFTKLCASYWLTWSKTVDRWCRFWLPMCFTVALGILFNLELQDEYATNPAAEMFQGFGPSYMTVAGVFRSLIMPFFAVATLFGANPFSTPVGQRIEKATDGNLPSEDWAANIEICDIINETDDGPKDASKAIRKRLSGNKNFKSVLLTLTVLETCVKNCGHRFHVLLAKKEFLDELVKILNPKVNPPQVVQEKILALIQDWADAFRGTPDLSNVLETYETLRAQGIEFPAKNLDTLSPIYTPERTQPERPATTPSRPPPSQTAVVHPQPAQPVPHMQAPVGPVVPTPEQLGKIRSELDVVHGNIAVMSEMLTEMTPGSEEAGDLQLLQELNRTCRAMQQRVLELIERVANEEVVGLLLSVNDDLNNVFIRYDRYERFRQNTVQQASPSEAPAEPPRPAAVAPLPVHAGRITTAWPEGAPRPPVPTPTSQPTPAPTPPAEAAAPAATGASDSLISFEDELPAASQAPSVNNVTSKMQALNVAPSPDTATAADQDDEFDMFAQSRKSTFDESRESGSSYSDNSQPLDRSIANSMAINKTEPKPEEPSPMDDIESWLHVTESDVAKAEAGAAQEGETLSSSEFDQFLAERAAAGGQRIGSTKSNGNRPKQRQMQMENQADDELFGL